jgi:tetratricopeptide (TPR) repeat protein
LRTAAVLLLILAVARGQTNSAARRAELAGDFAGAETAYEEEVKLRPSAETWQRLGLTRHLQSKFDSAIPAFREALGLDPSRWTARLFLGMCLYRLNDFKSARAELERADVQAPSNDAGRDEIDYWLSATLVDLKQPLAGLKTIERLLARAPSRLDALELAARVYADFGSSLWNQVAERSFESAAGWEVHGHALEAEGNVEGALDAYRQSRVLGPRRAGPGTAIGRLLLARGKPAEARAALDVELKLAPSDLWANYYAGLAAIQLGGTADAATLLETAALWATHDPEPSLALAQVYLAQGRYDQAADAARKALALDSRSAAARELLQSAEREK